MNYLLWAVLALVAYTLVAPLMSIATNGDASIPSNVATLLGNGILVAITLGVVSYTGENPTQYLTHPKAGFVYAAGACLGIGILAYYKALSQGPVSVVSPIFAMFLVTSSIVGILVLDEPASARKLAGIALAGVSVYLVSTG
ncbi:EamA family transporter [Haloarchaeobius sp. HME9146]|uniref:EamA family transporter n=1 Tax=Haloarchaeobius sp. HME9146 TaxID=2978732 RepID=UPI0021BF2D72|nr:EamA family transporter [Haloarchaeobius sp. HME9146]MCT9094948.1 EamA family transporter [Haloarchaeobius sp. HME9146]